MAGFRANLQRGSGAPAGNAQTLSDGWPDDLQEEKPAFRKAEPAASDLESAAQRRLQHIVSAIEGEIIPRLMLAHRTHVSSVQIPQACVEAPDSEDVEELVRLVLQHDSSVAVLFVEAVREQGVSIEAIYLDLLTPAARRLGDLWTDDLCDFAQVTLGLCRLQQVVHELGPRFVGEFAPSGHGYRVLLTSAPGEQHAFGLSIVAEFFRRAGWDVCFEPSASAAALTELMSNEWFDVVGFSASCEARLPTLASMIQTVRRTSRNQELGVMVGGRVFVAHPEQVSRVGADACAVDARQAVRQARRLVGLFARAAGAAVE